MIAGFKSRHFDRDRSARAPTSNPTTTTPILPQPCQSTGCSSYPSTRRRRVASTPGALRRRPIDSSYSVAESEERHTSRSVARFVLHDAGMGEGRSPEHERGGDAVSRRPGVLRRLRLLEVTDCVVELVPATGIAEPDDPAVILRQRVGLHRLARPGAGLVDAIWQCRERTWCLPWLDGRGLKPTSPRPRRAVANRHVQ